jgi:hypothetical protein
MESHTYLANAASAALRPFEAFLEQGVVFALIMQPVVVLGLTLLIMAKGYQALRSPSATQALLDVVSKTGRVVLCSGLALYVGIEFERMAGIVSQFQNFFAAMFAVSSESKDIYTWDNPQVVYQKLDLYISPYFDALEKVYHHANSYDNLNTPNARQEGLFVIISGFIQSSAVLLFAASIGLMLLYFKAALLICLMVAPLFILAGAFQSTTRLFFSWLSTLISYTFAAGMAAIPVGIALNALQSFGIAFNLAVDQTGVGGSSGLDYIKTPLIALLTNGMLMFLSLKIPPLAGKLVGGMIAPTSGSDAGQIFNSARGLANAGRSSNLNGGAGGVGSTARGANGQFIRNSAVAGSPAHQLSMALDRGINHFSDAKNVVLSTPRGMPKTPSTKSAMSGRAPQQTVADRRALTAGSPPTQP